MDLHLGCCSAKPIAIVPHATSDHRKYSVDSDRQSVLQRHQLVEHMVPNQENQSVSTAAVPGNGSYMHAHIHTQCSLSCTQTTINNNHQYIVTRWGFPPPQSSPWPRATAAISYTSKLLHGCNTRKILVLVNRVICDTDSRLQGVLRLVRRTVSSTDTPLHQQPRAGWHNARTSHF